MWRHSWLLLGAFWACSSTEDTSNPPPPRVTRVQVNPQAFLGSVPCDNRGGMEMYQASLLDVTDGLDAAFVLPHSRIVPCTSVLHFEYVKPGRRYIAMISAFDRSDISQQNPASSVIVDEMGGSVAPRWTTTCWGKNDAPQLGLGGSGMMNAGGAGGSSNSEGLGLEAFDKTTVVMQGCEELKDTGTPGPSAVAFDITRSLLNQECGEGPGEVANFTVLPAESSPPAVGGAPSKALGGAGMGGNPGSETELVSCGEILTLTNQEPGEHLVFTAFAYESASMTPAWSTTCRTFTVQGITVDAHCDPLAPFD